MPIDNRNLTPGMKLVARYHKQTYRCEVVQAEGGKLLFRLEDGREFKSISAAGMAITGKSCNGWAFWSIEKPEGAPAAETAAPAETVAEPAPAADATVETSTAQTQTEQPVEETRAGTEPESATVTPKTEEQPAQATAEPTPARKRIYRLPNQRGVPEGQTRWYCHECAKSFTAPAGETPEACPQGHSA